MRICLFGILYFFHLYSQKWFGAYNMNNKQRYTHCQQISKMLVEQSSSRIESHVWFDNTCCKLCWTELVYFCFDSIVFCI